MAQYMNVEFRERSWFICFCNLPMAKTNFVSQVHNILLGNFTCRKLYLGNKSVDINSFIIISSYMIAKKLGECA